MNEVVTSRRRIGAAMSLLLVAFLVFGFAPDRAVAAKTLGRVQMLSLTNQAREQKHKSDLALNNKLSHFAKKHSRAMAKMGYLFHTDSDVLIKALQGYDWSIGGENVGVGSTLDGLQSAFMHSKEHRQNILRKQFDHAAIGVFHSDGQLWVTVIFYG